MQWRNNDWILHSDIEAKDTKRTKRRLDSQTTEAMMQLVIGAAKSPVPASGMKNVVLLDPE